MRRMIGDKAVEAEPAVVTSPAWAATAGAAGAGAAMQERQSNGAAFDANMVIVLAALLCVLIFALGLNSVIRCALHCARAGGGVLTAPPASTRLATATAPAAAVAVTAVTAAAGLRKKELRRIPVVSYAAPDSGDVPATECAICLGEFDDGDKVRVLPRCHHGFHVGCIDTWLAAHPSCPTCRDSILAPEDGGAATDAGGQR